MEAALGNLQATSKTIVPKPVDTAQMDQALLLLLNPYLHVRTTAFLDPQLAAFLSIFAITLPHMEAALEFMQITSNNIAQKPVDTAQVNALYYVKYC